MCQSVIEQVFSAEKKRVAKNAEIQKIYEELCAMIPYESAGKLGSLLNLLEEERLKENSYFFSEGFRCGFKMSFEIFKE